MDFEISLKSFVVFEKWDLGFEDFKFFNVFVFRIKNQKLFLNLQFNYQYYNYYYYNNNVEYKIMKLKNKIIFSICYQFFLF